MVNVSRFLRHIIVFSAGLGIAVPVDGRTLHTLHEMHVMHVLDTMVHPVYSLLLQQQSKPQGEPTQATSQQESVSASRFQLTEHQNALDFLLEQLDADSTQQMSKSVQLVLDGMGGEVVGDTRWVGFYLDVVSDLDKRGFPLIASRLLLFLDPSELEALQRQDYFNLRAQIYQSVGQYAEAIEWYRKALENGNDVGSEDATYNILNNVATAYMAVEDYEGALRYNRYVMDMLDKGYTVEPVDLARFYANAGTTYRRLKDLDRAEELYRESLSISTPGFTLSRSLTLIK